MALLPRAKRMSAPPLRASTSPAHISAELGHAFASRFSVIRTVSRSDDVARDAILLVSRGRRERRAALT